MKSEHPLSLSDGSEPHGITVAATKRYVRIGTYRLTHEAYRKMKEWLDRDLAHHTTGKEGKT